MNGVCVCVCDDQTFFNSQEGLFISLFFFFFSSSLFLLSQLHIHIQHNNLSTQDVIMIMKDTKLTIDCHPTFQLLEKFKRTSRDDRPVSNSLYT